MEGTMSEIRYFAGDFSPKTWAYCQGQTLAINTNQALFSLLGTMYGGNGVTTFCLPDFRSRMPVGTGNAAGITTYQLGEMDGAESVTVSQLQMPAHMHPGVCQVKVPAYSETGTAPSPINGILSSLNGLYNPAGTGDTVLASLHIQATVSTAGNNQPISTIQPYLAMNAIICLMGIFPSRN